MNCGIYQIRNIVNNKIYIGSTNNFQSRKYSHFETLRKNTHSNSHLQNAYNEYGENNFVFEIIESISDATEKQLETREQWYLDNTKCLDRDFGYNIKPSAGNKRHSDETKMKIRNGQIGENNSNYGNKYSRESRLRISLSKRGKNHPMYGKHHSDASKNKMSKSHIGIKSSDESRHKMSLAKRGKKRSEETKRKISESMKKKFI